jgi:hypothetical protein
MRSQQLNTDAEGVPLQGVLLNRDAKRAARLAYRLRRKKSRAKFLKMTEGRSLNRFGVAVDRPILQTMRAPKLLPHVSSRKGAGRGWSRVNVRSINPFVGFFSTERREHDRRCSDSPIYFAWPVLDRRNVTRRSS